MSEDKTGKTLERPVADLYRVLGAWKVEHDILNAGHQIDVHVEMFGSTTLVTVTPGGCAGPCSVNFCSRRTLLLLSDWSDVKRRNCVWRIPNPPRAKM